MNTRAIRLPLALFAIALLVAVLSFLLIESRSVRDEYYLSHADRMRVVAAARDDVAVVVNEANVAFSQGTAFGGSAVAALERLAAGNQTLQTKNNMLRVTPELDLELASYDAAMRQYLIAGRQFASQQDELAIRVLKLQEQSPLLVRFLRENNLDELAQQCFSLAIDVLEYTSGKGVRVAAPLELRSNALRLEPVEPETATRLSDFANLTEQLIAAHAISAAALEQLAPRAVREELAGLATQLEANNRQTVSRAELARSLLTGCAILLLLAAAYAVWRLQASYRELNSINAGLEERVLERTDLLSKAYDELKESQVQLIHAEKMSSLGEMVAGISHEINTPLWYLTNNASVLQERLSVISRLCDINETMLAAVRSRQSVNDAVSEGLRKLDELMGEGLRDDVEEAISLAQDSIDGLDDLTELAQGLKDFSRLDRAAQSEFNVNEGIERTLLIAKNHIKHKAKVETHFGRLPDIYCSPSQLNQVFLNLLTNAADAIESSGKIVIHTSLQNDRVEISIADSGGGIAADIIGKVRDPFFTTKNVGDGTGLGLSIVDRIVAQHDGELVIESVPGKGTTVTVRLPIGDRPGSAQGIRDLSNSAENTNSATFDVRRFGPHSHVNDGTDNRGALPA